MMKKKKCAYGEFFTKYASIPVYPEDDIVFKKVLYQEWWVRKDIVFSLIFTILAGILYHCSMQPIDICRTPP